MGSEMCNKRQSIDRHVPTEDLTTLVKFLHSAEDEAEELLEVDGVVVTTNQLDDYNHRGDHPLLAPMTLYVYSMWVHRVEAVQTHGEQRCVRVPFHSSYKLAVGYTQQITVTERVPKIDGYTMPPPRSGGAGTVSDQELNAMFKSVLHRPTRLASLSASTALDTVAGDPLACYAELHAKPMHEDPSHPWSPSTAFSGAWHAHLEIVKVHAQAASRKLLARQELETIWETQEMEVVLCDLLDVPLPVPVPTSAEGLDCSRLTCKEYVAYVTLEVVQNMDAIAWARVNRKTRLPELCQHLEVLGGGRGVQHRDEDENVSSIMGAPGLLRKIPFPFEDLSQAFEHVQALGERSTTFAKELSEFFTVQQLTLTNTPVSHSSRATQTFWSDRATAVGKVRGACDALLKASLDCEFLTDCLEEQTRAIKELSLIHI